MISPMNYNAAETLNVKEATAGVYFSSFVEYYQGRISDPQKHRIVRYDAVLKNTGPKKKSLILAELVGDPEFLKLISDPWASSSLPVPCFPIKSLPPGGEASIPCGIVGLAEGDPAEIEKIAEHTKIRFVWEEGGKKWEKIAPVVLSEFPWEYPSDYYNEDKYETGKTLELAQPVQGGIEENYLSVNFSPEPIILDWYKNIQPNPERHRNVVYSVPLRNIGKGVKKFVWIQPLLDSSFQKIIINSQAATPRFFITPGMVYSTDLAYYLAEGDPAEIEKLAEKTKLRILWTEGGKKYEKIVGVRLIKQ